MKKIYYLFIILLIASCAPSDNELWNEAKSINTIESYEAYLKSNEELKYADSAKFLIENLFWKKTISKNSIDNYTKYIKNYSQGIYTDDARWNIIKIKNTFAEYELFLEKNKKSKYYQEAIDSILKKNIFFKVEINNTAILHNICVSRKNCIYGVGAKNNLQKTWIFSFNNNNKLVFDKKISHANTYEQYRDIIEINDTLYACGYISGLLPYNGIMFAKLDTTGKILSEKIYNQLNAGIAMDITKCSNDKFILVGDVKDKFKMHYQNGIVLKVDKNGKIEWHKIITEPGIQLLGLRKAEIGTDSAIYIIGNKGISELFFVKMNLDGKILWKKNYTEKINFADYTIDNEGNMVIIGSDYIYPYDNVVVIKINPKNGKLISKSTIKKNKYIPESFVSTVDTGFIIVGRKIIKQHHKNNLWITKISKDDEIEWEKEYEYNYKLSNLRIAISDKNEYFVVGTKMKMYSSKGNFYIKL